MRSILHRLIKANGDDDTLGTRLLYIFLMFAVVYLSAHMIYYLLVSHDYHLIGL